MINERTADRVQDLLGDPCLLQIPRSFTAIINRCDLNSKTGQEYLEFLVRRGYLVPVTEGEKTSYHSAPAAAEYIAIFSSLYQKLFDATPDFKL